MKKITSALALSISLLCSANTFAAAEDDLINDKFLAALESREAGDLVKAIEQLKALLDIAPNIGRVRLEMAVAYYRLKLFDEAIASAEDVVADPNTPEDVVLTVSLFLAELEASKEAQKAVESVKHQFLGNVSLSFGQDTNVNAGPSSGTIIIGGATLTFTPGTLPQQGTYISASAGMSHQYAVSNSLNIGSKPVTLLWNSSVNVSTKVYDELTAFSLDVLTLSTGPAFLSQTNWRANVQMQFDYITLGSEVLGQYTSLTPSYTLILNDAKTELTATGSFLKSQFHRDSNDNIEGDRYGLTLDLAHKFSEKISTSIGLSHHESDLDASFESNKEEAFFADVFFSAWENGTVYMNYRYTEKDYDKINPIFAITREDAKDVWTFGVSHRITTGMIADWSLNAKVTKTDNDSNITPFEYEREEISLTASKRF